MSDDTKDLLAEVTLGIEAEAFLESAVGKVLIKRAESERDEALASLKTVDAANSETIRELQGRVWRAESVQTWMAEIIQSGWNAERMLQQMESPD